MTQSLVHRATVILFWSLPLLIPAFHAMRFMRSSPPLRVDSSLSWLALPAGLVIHENPLEDWSKLDVQVAPIYVEEVGSVPIKDDPEPLRETSRVEVHGHVGSGESVVYCLFDTKGKTWFRLSPGEVDKSRQIALTVSKEGVPQLVDLANGKRYRVQPGKRLLVPLEGSRKE